MSRPPSNIAIKRLINLASSHSESTPPEGVIEFPAAFCGLDKNTFSDFHERLSGDLHMAKNFLVLCAHWQWEDFDCEETMVAMIKHIQNARPYLRNDYDLMKWATQAASAFHDRNSRYKNTEMRMYKVLSGSEYLGFDAELWGEVNGQLILQDKTQFKDLDLIQACLEAAFVGYMDFDPVLSIRYIR